MNEITVLLRQGGTDNARESLLYELIYAELRQLARSAMRDERRDHTFQPTALVNEAYLRLVGTRPVSWQSRAHFFHAAARVMRRILIDHARARNAEKRDGQRCQVELADSMLIDLPQADELLAINIALDELQEISPRCAKVVELRFFAGLSVEEAAELMDLSAKTVKRETQFARAWLESRLEVRR